MERIIQVQDTFDNNLMAQYKENITFNNEDIEAVADWYQKSSNYYDSRIESARRYLITLVYQLTVNNDAGDEAVANILYSIRTATERLSAIKFRLVNVSKKLSKSRRNQGHQSKDLFPNEPHWSQYSDKIGLILKKLNASDEEQIKYIELECSY